MGLQRDLNLNPETRSSPFQLFCMLLKPTVESESALEMSRVKFWPPKYRRKSSSRMIDDKNSRTQNLFGTFYQRLGKIGSGGSSEVHKVVSSDCTIYALSSKSSSRVGTVLYSIWIFPRNWIFKEAQRQNQHHSAS